jgi:hypothetical protein
MRRKKFCCSWAVVAGLMLILRGEAENASPASADQRVPAPTRIFTFDARPLRTLDVRQPADAVRLWDTLHVLFALQGLANRAAPRLYIFYCRDFGVDTDQFWFDWLRDEDGWLKEVEVVPVADLAKAVERLRACCSGLVVYDPRVPATSNIGSTAAGCEELLPVRFDPAPESVYSLLTGRLHLPVRLWLVHPDGSSKFTGTGMLPDYPEPSSGSAKIDAYRWAVHRYLRNPGCAPGFGAYYIDSFWLRSPQHGPADLHTLSNHDYFIAHKGFFFDLSCWGDERPNDDPNQPLGLDRRMLLEVLRALYDRAGGQVVKIGGFTPWPFKYTDHPGVGGRHAGVPTEWELSRLVSQFNGYVEADAAGLSALANASFFQHYPLRQNYPQPNPKPSAETWRARGFLTSEGRLAAKLFVGHYVGDYDAPSWLYKAVPLFFRDSDRGCVPLGWAFNPNLADRVPQALVYAYRQASSNDFFIAGDSGAGYLNPRALTVRPDSGLPSGLEAWGEHCRPCYERWGMTITGFVLDGAAGASTDVEFGVYGRFAPDGAGTHFERGPRLISGIPTCPEKDLPGEVGPAAAVIARTATAQAGRPAFLWARSILKSPRWYVEVAEQLRAKHPEAQVEFVDPYTFFGLIKRQETGDR